MGGHSSSYSASFVGSTSASASEQRTAYTPSTSISSIRRLNLEQPNPHNLLSSQASLPSPSRPLPAPPTSSATAANRPTAPTPPAALASQNHRTIMSRLDHPLTYFLTGLTTYAWYTRHPNSRFFWFSLGFGAATWWTVARSEEVGEWRERWEERRARFGRAVGFGFRFGSGRRGRCGRGDGDDEGWVHGHGHGHRHGHGRREGREGKRREMDERGMSLFDG
jgi:hypothetical protein